MSEVKLYAYGKGDSLEQISRKNHILELMREAEELAYVYFQNCDLGEERIAAGQVYENIRTATMVRPQK